MIKQPNLQRIKVLELNINNINADNFQEKALEIFRYQAEEVLVYKDYIQHLGIEPSEVKQIEDIPFLPISFFKTHQVFHQNKTEEICFTSSGTTGMSASKHRVANLKIYEQSFKRAFNLFYGDIKEYCVLALLPSYLEREGSSLIYMADALIKDSEHPSSGFYLHNLEDLAEILQVLDSQGQKTMLLGVSYALLDLIEQNNFDLKYTVILETGGMKGQRKEMIKEEFYAVLKAGFGVSEIHSEYGMTELLSQAYSAGEGQYRCPPWMKTLIRDVNDPFCFLGKGKSGGLNIIDLANIDSCSFIATQDLGKHNLDGSFSILGRFDNSDIRGCNLMVN